VLIKYKIATKLNPINLDGKAEKIKDSVISNV
jgi:hypothetical protein